MKNKLFTQLLFGLITLSAYAQNTPLLERIVTVSLNEERVDAALKKIAQQGGFTFSYNPAILDEEKTINQNFVNKTVREILDRLFAGTIQYKARGKYIILTKAEMASTRKEVQVFSGYVVDEATGERLKDVSIYDPVTLSSTITDSYGYFEIEIDKPTTDLRLLINKQNYSDTIVIAPSKGRLLNIAMSTKMNTLADSVGIKMKRFWKKANVFSRQRINMVNIQDSIYRYVQLSFVPFIGSNHALSGNVVNEYSFNIIGGYSLGVNALEIGGAFNVVRGDVDGAQFAGVFNAVGGKLDGFQAAGVFNANRGIVDGAQFAGVSNFNWAEVDGFAAAGVFNFSRQTSRAVQLAGVGNITLGKQESPHFAGLFNFSARNAETQIAGAFNFAAGSMDGWQFGGVFNLAGKNVDGSQTAGVINVAAGGMQGAQIAGILNFSGKEMKGLQISGLVNYAARVRGVQIAPINISDSVRGVPIGLLSIVLKGYHKIELSADEIFYSNIAFRTGVRQFYNIITAGAKPSTFESPETIWTFGYGIGTAPKLSRKFYLNLDITANKIVQGKSIDALNLLNKVYLGVDYQIFKKMSISVGATLNAYVTDTTDGYKNIFTDYEPPIIHDRNYSNDLNMKMWLGGKIGLRFL